MLVRIKISEKKLAKLCIPEDVRKVLLDKKYMFVTEWISPKSVGINILGFTWSLPRKYVRRA